METGYLGRRFAPGRGCVLTGPRTGGSRGRGASARLLCTESHEALWGTASIHALRPRAVRPGLVLEIEGFSMAGKRPEFPAPQWHALLFSGDGWERREAISMAVRMRICEAQISFAQFFLTL